MKKTLLILTVSMLCSLQLIKAQTKTWLFSDAVWSTYTTAFLATTVIDNLGINPGPATVTTFGIIDSNSKTLPDGTAVTKRFKYGGASFTSSDVAPFVVPTQRYLYFDVSGSCTITVDFMSSSSGTATTIAMSDGSAQLPYTGSVNGGQAAPLSAVFTYTGAAKRLYLMALYPQAANFYRIIVTGATVNTTSSSLAVSDINKTNKTNVFSADNKVYINQVAKNSKVSVYNLNGQLIKSLNTDSDANFSLNPGIYMVSVKSDNGVVTKKVSIK